MAEHTKNASGWSVMDKGWERVQQKTFTKWCNQHLLKKGHGILSVENLHEEFATGINLARLINSLYDILIPKMNAAPKMRPNCIDNCSMALAMVKQAEIKTNFLGPENLVDQDLKMILGMIWAIILDYQIKGISVEDLSAKEGLLRWCQKKTAGYRDVKVENFTNSWQSGLAFCALIHRHRPDLIDYESLNKDNAAANLRLAFDIAEKELGIPALLDVEDIVDVPKPDERSIITYVSEYFHRFAAQNQNEVAGRRIAKLVGFQSEADQLKESYNHNAQGLVNWIAAKTAEMRSRDWENTLAGAERDWDNFRHYRKTEKPEKTAQKLEIETALQSLQTKLRVNGRAAYQPPHGLSPKDISAAWDNLGHEEKGRAAAIREELARQRRIANLVDRFTRKYEALHAWIRSEENLLSSAAIGNSVADVEAHLKNLDAFLADYQYVQNRMNTCVEAGQELISLGYSDAAGVTGRLGELQDMWSGLAGTLSTRRSTLEQALAHQQQLEVLRVEFAKKSRQLINWIEDAEGTCSEPVHTNTLQEAETQQSRFGSFRHEHAAKQAELDDLANLSDQLNSHGVTSNVYATVSFDEITTKWQNLETLASQHDHALQQETHRQQSNDALCQQFAAAATTFSQWCDSQRTALSGVQGELDDQLRQVYDLSQQIAQYAGELQSVIALDNQMGDANIAVNPHTDTTVEALHQEFSGLQTMVDASSQQIQKALTKSKDSGVPEELLTEFSETYRSFDKNSNNLLQRHEFKACLASLGHDTTDDSLNAVLHSICHTHTEPPQVTFDEFVKYMVEKSMDSDTATAIKQAFKTVAGDKVFVTEADLRMAGMDQDTISYLISRMPASNGGYDYTAFTDESYA